MSYTLLAGFLVLSGASSLIYEIIWTRLLSLNIGSDNLSISIILSCFFLGIALGSYLSASIKPPQKSLINVYILLELIIGVSALFLFPLFIHLDSVIQQFPIFSTSMLGKLIITALLLLIPTTCIGATFPIAVRLIIQTNKTLGLRISQLYFYNTFGAVMGSLLVGFVLIPTMGLDGANYFAIFLNFLIVMAAWYYRKYFLTTQQNTTKNTSPISSTCSINPANSQNGRIALISLALSGFILLSCEVAWGKYFALLTGASLQSFSVILAFTLLGIAFGSWFIRHRIPTIKTSIQYLALSYLLTAFLMMSLREGFTFLPALMNAINSFDVSLLTKQFYRYFILAIFIFPITFMLGVIFPIAISMYSQDTTQLHRKIANGYSVNTLSAVVGSIVTGFWFLPNFGTNSLFLFIICLLLILPIIVLFTTQTHKLRIAKIGLPLLPILGFSFYSDGLLYESLIPAVKYRYQGDIPISKKAEFLYIKEGKNSVISLVKYDNNYATVQKNGLPESSITLNDHSPTLIFETLQAYLPYLLHSNPQSAYVVGYGGGNTTQAFTDTDIQSIDVSEIEEIIIEAVKKIPDGPAIALKDKRVNLHITDARTALMRSTKNYDIITSQPSHPWIAGSSSLFSKEFFEIVKTRLNKDGIFSQWVPLFGIDESTLKSVLRTFYTVFPYGFTMEHKPSGDLMLIGSKMPTIFNFDQMKTRLEYTKIGKKLGAHNVNRPEDLFYLFALTREEIMTSTVGVTLNTDLNLLLELQSSKNYFHELNIDAPYKYIRSTRKLELLPYFPPDEVIERLFKLGLSYLEWNLPEKSQLIANQLDSVASELAKNIQYEIYYWLQNFSQATSLYNTKTDWPDRIHSHQIDISIRNNEWQEANKILNRIRSEEIGKTNRAMMLYKSFNWETLITITPESDQEELWILMAKVKKGDFMLLRKLNGMIEMNYLHLSQIKVLADVYRQLNSPQVAKWYLDNLNAIIKRRLTFYRILFTKAKTANNEEWHKNLKKLSSELIEITKTRSQ